MKVWTTLFIYCYCIVLSFCVFVEEIFFVGWYSQILGVVYNRNVFYCISLVCMWGGYYSSLESIKKRMILFLFMLIGVEEIIFEGSHSYIFGVIQYMKYVFETSKFTLFPGLTLL